MQYILLYSEASDMAMKLDASVRANCTATLQFARTNACGRYRSKSQQSFVLVLVYCGVAIDHCAIGGLHQNCYFGKCKKRSLSPETNPSETKIYTMQSRLLAVQENAENDSWLARADEAIAASSVGFATARSLSCVAPGGGISFLIIVLNELREQLSCAASCGRPCAGHFLDAARPGRSICSAAPRYGAAAVQQCSGVPTDTAAVPVVLGCGPGEWFGQPAVSGATDADDGAG